MADVDVSDAFVGEPAALFDKSVINELVVLVRGSKLEQERVVETEQPIIVKEVQSIPCKLERRQELLLDAEGGHVAGVQPIVLLSIDATFVTFVQSRQDCITHSGCSGGAGQGCRGLLAERSGAPPAGTGP